ncbi:hypothetical protein Taro_033646 [Colocasia esculenta]|uniref:Uncharacterized protein n=1 Tax=Colocasia esculenta TaxID=4460 RepID=A0A843VVT2_COLES|nr:hypothetical protein [Colocasia esculenta]
MRNKMLHLDNLLQLLHAMKLFRLNL